MSIALSENSRAFLRYAADVAAENQRSLRVEDLLRAAIDGAAARARLGALAAPVDAEIESVLREVFFDRSFTAEEIVSTLHAVAA